MYELMAILLMLIPIGGLIIHKNYIWAGICSALCIFTWLVDEPAGAGVMAILFMPVAIVVVVATAVMRRKKNKDKVREEDNMQKTSVLETELHRIQEETKALEQKATELAHILAERKEAEQSKIAEEEQKIKPKEMECQLADKEVSKYNDYIVVGPSKHKVRRLYELWSDAWTSSGISYESSYREAYVTSTDFDEATLYTDGQRYFVIRKTGSSKTGEAVPNSAGWGYVGSDDTRLDLYEVDGNLEKEALRQQVRNNLRPCVFRYDDCVQALLEAYFKRVEEKKEAERKDVVNMTDIKPVGDNQSTTKSEKIKNFKIHRVLREWRITCEGGSGYSLSPEHIVTKDGKVYIIYEGRYYPLVSGTLLQSENYEAKIAPGDDPSVYVEKTLMVYLRHVDRRDNIKTSSDGLFDYILNDDGRACICGYNGNEQAVVIPEIIDGCSVTEVGRYAFVSCEWLTDVTIANNIEEIGSGAFYGCSGLTNIVIPNSVKKIAMWAFQNCTELKSIEIPDSVTEIGWHAFEGCTSLSNIMIPNSITELGSDVFRDCSKLTNVVIPDSVKKIGGGAFQNCIGLKSIEILNSATEIGWHTFEGCDKLTIYAPDGSATEQYAEQNKISFKIQNHQ